MIPILKAQCDLAPLFERPSIHSSWIHGQKIKGSATVSIPHFYPGTGQQIGSLQSITQAELEQAIDSATDGFLTWSRWTGLQRSRVLFKAAQLLQKYADELAYLETLDTGKPISESIT